MCSVTLVWTDPPGRGLQNDLDLIVKGPNNIEKHVNMGDRPEFDRSNNVEQVVWTSLPAEDIRIIHGSCVPHIFKQKLAHPYALCWSIHRPLK
jgi:hypothetical protein